MPFLDLTWKLLNLLKNRNLAWVVLWLVIAPGALAEADPAEVVNAFHEALISAMKAPDYESRLAIVGPAVEANFQVHTISRISLGRNWSTLSEEKKADFQAIITELITSTYSSRFNNYDGQVFAIIGSEDMKRERKRVKSTLTTKNETVTLDYQLQQVDDGWRIYDIVANGVSDLSLKRSNYDALYKSGGLDAVTAEISQNIADNQPDPG